MAVIRLHRVHESQLEQLTGCRYAVLWRLYEQVRVLLLARRRPFKHGVFIALVLTLMKLRHALTLHTLQALTGIDAVTAMRCIERVTKVLAQLPLAPSARTLLLDSCSIRVSTTDEGSYSGHKHHRCAKVQALARQDGLIVDVSPAHLGSTHDKTLWNKELPCLKHLIEGLVRRTRLTRTPRAK